MGASFYYGDLAPLENILTSSANSLRWGGSVEYSRHFSPKMSANLELNWVRLGADDFDSNTLEAFARNLHFRNDIKEITLSSRYYPISMVGNFTKRDKLVPSLFIGLGYYWHNPKAKIPINMGNEWVDLFPLHTEGQGLNAIYQNLYKLSGISIPCGIGLKYKYSKSIDLGVDISYRFVFTDYLDDVSGIYPNTLFFSNDIYAKAMSSRLKEIVSARTGENRIPKLTELLASNGINTSDPISAISALGATGALRGSVDGNDSFLTVFLKVRYLFGDGIKCPK